LWKARLRCVLSVDGSSPLLRQKLGEWNDSVKIEEWDTLIFDHTTHFEVYSRLANEGQYSMHSAVVGGRSGRTVVNGTSTITVDSVPCGAWPCSLGPVCRNGNRRVEFRRLMLSAHDSANSPVVRTFSEYVSAQSAHIRDLLAHCDTSETAATLFAERFISIPDMHSGTDGGLLQGFGTFGYVWGDPNENEILSKGKGHVSGTPVFMSSTRTELCGMLASLTYLRLIIQYFHIVIPKQGFQCTVHFDSLAALNRVKDLTYDAFGTTWRCRANYDMEAAIRVCLQQGQIMVDWKWIRGHASNRKRRDEFVWAEILNEAADDLATAARDYTATQDDEHWPEQEVSIIGARGRMSGRMAHEIRYWLLHCTRPPLLLAKQIRLDESSS
jgi:hypothetical protein